MRLITFPSVIIASALFMLPVITAQARGLSSILNEVSSEFNENLPKMVDSTTRLDTTFVLNKKLYYVNTIVNSSAEDIEPSSFYLKMNEKIINNYCTTPDMKVYRQFNVPCVWRWYGKHGKYITEVEVSPSQCK
jgi:hypothetical protein